MMEMLPVIVTKIEDAGNFTCQPYTEKNMSDSYLDLLAKVNTFYHDLKESHIISTLQNGQLLACKTSLGNSRSGLWYRGRVIEQFSSTAGVMAKILLIDEGQTCFASKLSLRRLEDMFATLPPQVLLCRLYGVIPITLGPCYDSLVSMQKTNKWDSSATQFVQKALNGRNLFIAIESVDDSGINLVRLYIQTPSDGRVCINDLLVQKKFAVDSGSFVAQEDIGNDSAPKSASSPNRHKITSPDLTYVQNLDLQKHKRTQEAAVHTLWSDDVQELRDIICHDSDYASGIEHDDSKTSGLSDSETAPVRGTAFYDNRVDTAKAERLVKLLGKESGELLAKAFGIDGSSSVSSTSPPILVQSEDKSAGQLQNLEPKYGQASDTCSSSFVRAQNEAKLSYSSRKKVTFNDTDMRPSLVCSSSDSESCRVSDFGTELSKTAKRQFELFQISYSNSDSERKGTSDIFVNPPNVHQTLEIAQHHQTKQSHSSATTSFGDVFVWGKIKSSPFQSIEYLHLPLPLRSALKGMGVSQPSGFQSYMWPAVMKGRDVVGIAASFSDLMISSLMPIFSNIVDPDGVYSSICKGNGPYLMILVANWREAQDVYDLCRELLSFYKSTRIEVIFGGRDCEVAKNIELLNGCEVLISTPPFLIKMLEGGFTNLARCCHILFCSADVLVRHFADDIKQLIRDYAQVIKRKKRFDAPRQLIAVGTKWSVGVKSLMESYFTDPVVVIHNKLEVAVFAGVSQVVNMCKSEDRMDLLVSYLETDATSQNTIVFTQSARDAEQLARHLNNYSLSPLLLTEFLSPAEIKDVKLSWNAHWAKKANVLLMSDPATSAAGIYNASCVINYDFPSRKAVYADRLGCLLQTIQANEGKSDADKLVSLILLTEKHCAKYANGLVQLLERAGADVRQDLMSMSLAAKEFKEEEKKDRELCSQLKLFGECIHADDCNERHTVFPDVDLLNLVPCSGIVKVAILDVISASSYWGRIIHHRIPFDKKTETYDTSKYLQLAMDVQIHYANQSNRQTLADPQPYNRCVVRMKDGFQRVRIEELVGMPPTSAKVFGLDNGQTLTVPLSSLLACPEEILAVPSQVVEVIVCSVRPVDKSPSWTIDACTMVEKSILGQTVEGRIQFCLRNTIWVDPCIKMQKLENVNAMICGANLGADLIKMGFAVRNAKHSKTLRSIIERAHGTKRFESNSWELCRGMPARTTHEYAFIEDEAFEDVYVSAVTHPGLFYVQHGSCSDEIEELDDRVDATMKVAVNNDVRVLPVGGIAVAQFSADNRWYRAKIMDVNVEAKTYDVFFVDHGDREWRPYSKVRPSWPDIERLPFQAIECCFQGISPVNAEWTSQDGDALWDLTKDRLLSIKVLSTSASKVTPEAICYEVDLFDATSDVTVNIGHELVLLGIAQGSQECLQAMFPYASRPDVKVEYKNDCQRIPDLCLMIHRAQNCDQKMKFCNDLRDSVLRNIADSVGLVEFGGIQSLCRLLALSRYNDVQEVIVACLTAVLSRNKQLCNVVLEEGGVKALCGILKKNESEVLSKACAEALSCAGEDEMYQNRVHEYGGVCALCKLLQSTSDPKVMQAVFKAVSVLCRKNDSICSACRQEGLLESVSTTLETCADQSTLRSCASCLTDLLRHPRNQEKLREVGGLTVLASLLGKDLSELVLKEVLLALQAAISANQLNRDFLHRLGSHANMKRCSDQPIRRSIVVRQLLTDLTEQISPAPTTHILAPPAQPSECGWKLPSLARDVQFLNMDQPTGLKKSIPRTEWSQRKNTVTLAVKLRGVSREKTRLEEERVYFRTVLDEVEYELELALFKPICPKESRVLLKGSEVLIILRKEALGEIWPRLLKGVEKPAYLCVDFDRWVDDVSALEEVGAEDSPHRGSSNVLFMPGLPPPPPSSEKYVPAVDTDSDDGERRTSTSDESDAYDSDGLRNQDQNFKHPEYFDL